MIVFMIRSRIVAACCCLSGLTLWLIVACAGPAATPVTPSPERGARLFTRTPVPEATPTPTLDPQILHQQGLTQRDAWDLETALDRFSRALALAPSAQLSANRAEVYRLLGRHEEAAADIAEALTLDPDLAEAWRQKALLNRTDEEWNEALTAVNKLIELEPDDGSAFVLRARIYSEGIGEMRHALGDYRRAIRRDPLYDEATLVERWRILATLEQWEEALRIGQKMASTGSQDPLRYYYRGWPLIQLGRLDAAIRTLLFGVERYPDYPGALYYALGVAYYERRAWAEAIQALEVALIQSGTASSENSLAPPLGMTDAGILGPLGIAYLELKQCETGAAIVERAIAESPDPGEWVWARQRAEECYASLTPTPEGPVKPK